MPTITRDHATEIVEHARETNPYECCGILAGINDTASHLYRIRNTSSNPHRYLMDPQQQLDVILETRNHGRDLLAFYHSHPRNRAYPSATDVREAQRSGWLGEDIYYILVSLETDEPDIRAFHIMEDGVIVEKPLVIHPAAAS